MRLKQLSAALSLSALALLSTACGKTEKYIQNWSVKAQDNHFTVKATFNQNYELDGEASILFKNHGTVTIGQDDNRNFSIALDLQTDVFDDVDLAQVTSLPTGQPFPSIVNGPLGYIQLLDQDGKWKVGGYFARQTAPENSKTLVGVGIEMKGIDSSFPALSLTQNYYTDDNRRFGSLTIYGPKLGPQGQVVVPGGLMVLVDLKVLKSKNKGKLPKNIEFKVSKNFEITGPHADRYKSKRARQALAMKFMHAVEKSGVIKRK